MTHSTLAHGRMEIMATLQQLLLERGLSSLAINLSLGLADREGMYDCATPHRLRHADALDEIDSWATWIERQGVTELALLGHSRGGNQTAWYAAERLRAFARKVVLVAPLTWVAAAESVAYRKRYGADLAPLLEGMQARIAQGQGDAPVEGVDFIYCEGATVTPISFVSYYADEPRRDTPTLLPRIAVPVLVIAGSANTVVTGLEPRMAPLAEGAKVRLAVVDGADHMFRDLYAEDVADLIAEFVQGE